MAVVVVDGTRQVLEFPTALPFVILFKGARFAEVVSVFVFTDREGN